MLGESLKEDNEDFVPKEEQRGLLSSSNRSDPCSSLDLETNTISFSGESITSFIELAKTLKKIHIRLTMEGYIIEEGRIYKP